VIFTKLAIAGAYVIEPTQHKDERGFFAPLWCASTMRDHRLAADISQINAAVSPRERTLRGLHYQLAPHAEVAVVRCVRGAVYDVIVEPPAPVTQLSRPGPMRPRRRAACASTTPRLQSWGHRAGNRF
jgi:dTDP-4-dehydrorhamnose 3,5-epimerase-like enzyme